MRKDIKFMTTLVFLAVIITIAITAWHDVAKSKHNRNYTVECIGGYEWLVSVEVGAAQQIMQEDVSEGCLVPIKCEEEK